MSKWYEVTLTVGYTAQVEVPDKSNDPDIWDIPENEEASKKMALEYASDECRGEVLQSEIMEIDGPMRGATDDILKL